MLHGCWAAAISLFHLLLGADALAMKEQGGYKPQLHARGTLIAASKLMDVGYIADNQRNILNWDCLTQRVDPTQLNKSFNTVAREHPGVPPMCLYQTGRDDPLSWCADAKHRNDYLFYAMQVGSVDIMGSRTTEKEPLGFEHRDFSTDYKFYAQNSAYCLQNGWLDRSRVTREGVRNATWLKAFAKSECDAVRKVYPYWDSLPWTVYMFHKKFWDKKDKTTAQIHALWACFMESLECDIANCAYNHCKFDDGFIGHGGQCGSEWLQHSDIKSYWSAVGRIKPNLTHLGPPENWMGKIY